MKALNFKSYFLFFLAFGVLAFSGCNNDDDEDDHMHEDNKVTITILEPAADEVVADASDVHIHIKFEATDENHEVEINLHTEDDPSTSIAPFPIDEHDHDQVIEKVYDLDLSSYPAGTEFHLEVSACEDHDCESKANADVEFSIQ